MTECFVCHKLLLKPEENWGTPQYPVCGGCSKGISTLDLLFKPIGKYRRMMLEKRRDVTNLEKNYFAQFAGEKLNRYVCQNCGARFLAESAPRDPDFRVVCCASCLFNPLGCRCKFGEWGVAETEDWGDPDDDYGDDWDDDCY